MVTASLRALETKEVVCAPGVENDDLLREALAANLRAFGGQSPTLATRYQ